MRPLPVKVAGMAPSSELILKATRFWVMCCLASILNPRDSTRAFSFKWRKFYVVAGDTRLEPEYWDTFTFLPEPERLELQLLQTQNRHFTGNNDVCVSLVVTVRIILTLLIIGIWT